jgi:hypothetical protein
LHIWEILDDNAGLKSTPKRGKRTQKTDFEKNARKLRNRERKLDAQKPVKAVSPN